MSLDLYNTVRVDKDINISNIPTRWLRAPNILQSILMTEEIKFFKSIIISNRTNGKYIDLDKVKTRLEDYWQTIKE